MNPGFCGNCAAFAGTAVLVCSACGAFVHAAQLEQLAAQAQSATASGDFGRARDLWVQSLAFLPEGTLQHQSVSARIQELDARIAEGAQKKQSAFGKRIAGLGPLGVLLWKLKAILLGLTKMSTVLSMLASLGVYWALYGWKFGAGLVISIYIHEMGHVQALRRYGIAASAPMFIPGFGAFIRLRAAYLSPVQDSRVGLAGPIYGLGAAATALALGAITGAKIWDAIAQFGATINLFNLIPIWQLDGARGLYSLTRNQRMVIPAAAVTLWYVTREPMLILIALVGGYRLFTKDAAQEPDPVCLQQYAGLLVVLAAIGVFAKKLSLP